jgi:hypothetical protein
VFLDTRQHVRKYAAICIQTDPGAQHALVRPVSCFNAWLHGVMTPMGELAGQTCAVTLLH